MKNNWDAEDALLGSIFAFATGSTVGIADVTMFGTSLQNTALTLGQEAIPVGGVLAAVIFGIAYFTNDVDIGRLDDEYTYAVLGTAAMLLLIPTIPSLLEFVKGSDFVALGAVVVQSAGYAGVSYLG